MEWGAVWRTIFCGWEGEVDLVTLARELAECGGRVGAVDDQDAASWVCRQIQEAY